MSLWRQVTYGVRGLFRRDERFREAADEVEDYVERATADYVAQGLASTEARRRARAEAGAVTGAVAEVRGYGWERLADAFVTDVRFAARRLRAERGFTALMVLTLALGIGASTAIISTVRPVLLEPLPYPGADRIVTVWDRSGDGERLEATFNTQQELRARSTTFVALAAYRPWWPTLTGLDEPERLEGQRVGWEYFAALGVPPALGRGIDVADDRPDAPPTVVLSDGLWRRRFGADPAILGRLVTLGGAPHTVVGVMPPRFENVLAPAAEVWTALQYASTEGRAWGHHLRLVGRLRPGISEASAAQELATIAGHPVPEFPRASWAALSNGLLLTTLHADLTRDIRPALLVILGAVALVLLLACVNATNLLLGRGARRRGEFQLRAMLGARSGRLVRQTLTESLFLAALGGVAGVALAAIGVRALVALSPAGLPRIDAVAIDGWVLGFALTLTAMVGAVLGLVPARSALRDTRFDGTRSVTVRHHATRGALVVAQVALALVLLACSGLLLRSMQRVIAVDLGFSPARVLTMQVQASGPRVLQPEGVRDFFASALETVAQVPGVSVAALTSQLPLTTDLDLYGVQLDPHRADDPGEQRGTFRYVVSPSYFAALGIPLRSGRLLDAGDRAGTLPVAVVSESFARRRLGGQDPLGYRVRIGADEQAYAIVGVVADVRQASRTADETDAVYIVAAQVPALDLTMSFVIRTEGDALFLTGPVRRAIWSVDKDQAVSRIATMEQLVADSTADRRFALLVFEAFAMVALVLAAAGLYGVLAGSVAERTREIGVRAAVGASPTAIVGLVVRQGMALAIGGVAIGLGAAITVTRLLGAMLFGVSPLDPVTYGAVILLLAAMAMLACVVPAWRAVRVDPVQALRA